MPKGNPSYLQCFREPLDCKLLCPVSFHNWTSFNFMPHIWRFSMVLEHTGTQFISPMSIRLCFYNLNIYKKKIIIEIII
jgi:hypothetical protein